ncbi:MAG: GNAT family N-acetyltransferase [Lachnospira sp.]
MKIEPVKLEDAEELLSIYAPYVQDTAISFEYEVPSLSVFQDRKAYDFPKRMTNI